MRVIGFDDFGGGSGGLGRSDGDGRKKFLAKKFCASRAATQKESTSISKPKQSLNLDFRPPLW